jgi:PAS domain S-box-containing protein
MDDVWFAQGAKHVDFDACLEALGLLEKERVPLLAVTTGDVEPRLLLASRALFALFGVATSEELSERLLRGHDPGARRLGFLCQSLALEGAPRLERLRFFIGPGTEIITFLCRRLPVEGVPRFIAAALGIRPGLIPDEFATTPASAAVAPAPPPVADEPQDLPVPLDTPMTVQAIQSALRTRWPVSRTVRFLWQADSDLVCTQVSPLLADIVGAANADLVGRDLMGLAPQIDPSGQLASALASRATWSGLNVDWPITDAPAAVSIGLGAIPAIDRERDFEGYRGYGVIHLDKIVPRDPLRFDPALPRDAEPDAHANVVRFPGTKALSAEDQKTFVALGAELREEAGLVDTGILPLEPVLAPTPAAPLKAAEAMAPPGPTDVLPDDTHQAEAPDAVPESLKDATPPDSGGKGSTAQAPDANAGAADRDAKRAADIARHGLAILDRFAVGLLVSRDNVPIFANRFLLDLLGFADEDALHEAGGTMHLFGGQPGNVSGSETIGLRTRDGRIIASQARMQTLDWEGLPATLLTLQPVLVAETPAAPETDTPPSPAASADMRGADADVAAAPDELHELRAILETATDGVVVIDADGNVTSLNRSGEALFGCDRGSVIGKPFLSLFADHNQSLAADYLDGLKSNATKRLLNDGREFLVNVHRGGTIPVFMTLGRLGPASGSEQAETGAGARFCALFRDLTHWKKVERDLEAAKVEAERANALKTDFLAKVSHEIRTPLNAIIGFADVMMEGRFGPLGNERYKEYVRDIHASGTHVMSLVDDLLDLSKIEAGKMDLAVEAIDANKVISECVALMQPQASRARIIMRLSLAPALPQIKADERSLRQIVLNLLSNAVKFNEPGGQVIVATATPETGHVVIRIRDTGPGMSEADIAAALEPFRQLSTGRAQAAGDQMPSGTGLGLPLTKALVEANQASFTIRSKVDHGTLVEVAFPPARVLAR